MTDSLLISHLSLYTRIGVTAEERKKEQHLRIDVEMLGSLKPVAEADDIAAGINYAQVARDIETLGKTERKTIERLAEDIAAMVLKDHKPASVKVSVWKEPENLNARACACIVRP